MNIPQPTNPTQKTKYAQIMYDIQAYKSTFPRTHKPLPKSRYDMHYVEIQDLIENSPPLPSETPTMYYARLDTTLSKRLIGIGLTDMGYVRKSARIDGHVQKTWVLPT